jgi:ActR/RegA family two-component response regulator
MSYAQAAGHIAHVLDVVGSNQRRAARALGITRWSLARRLTKYGLPVRQPEGGTWPRTHDE